MLAKRPRNIYVANGATVVLAKRGKFDIAKEIFTHVQEANVGNIFVKMLDVWLNQAHVYFAHGQFVLVVKMFMSQMGQPL